MDTDQFIQLLIAIIGFFGVYTLKEIKDEIKELKQTVKDLEKDLRAGLTSLDRRVTKLETILGEVPSAQPTRSD